MITYHSSKTNNFYETEEAAFEAEHEFDEKKAKQAELEETKKIRREGVEKAFEDAYALLDEYVKDYGEFTGEIDVPFDIRKIDLFPSEKLSLFDRFFRW